MAGPVQPNLTGVDATGDVEILANAAGQQNHYKFTPEKYLLQIIAHSATSLETSLFQGQHYFGLALFLQEANRPDRNGQDDGGQSFVTFYALDSETTSARPVNLPRSFYPLTRGDHLSPNEVGVLFLRGYASASSLLELGAAYNIDPELFQRHLQFLEPGSAMNKPALLPSAQSSVFQLSVTTVGRHVTPQYRSLQEKRRRVSAGMTTYVEGLIRGECISKTWGRTGKNSRPWKSNESIVRSFAVHDDHEFSIQQLISVCVAWDREMDIWQAIIWLDSGLDLRHSPWGPWLESAKDIFFYPVSLYRSRVALKKHQYPGHEPRHIDSERAAQSISLLPLAFGQSLNPKVMREDPFYALSEIFNFVAASEMQFLTAVERHLGLGSSDLQEYFEQPSLSGHADLLFFRNLLEDHVNNITETYTFIKNRSTLKWPRSSANLAQRAALQLEIDFEALLERARLMRSRCEREINVLMSKAQLAEAKRGIVKTKKALTLTVLATILLPGTATATVFGMNFVQFEHTWQGIVLWILVTTLLMVICFVTVSWDEGLLLYIRKRRRHMA
ncbi:MAG: hypothetical protein Q9222_006791 [Ikaeria aurantiellina]